MYINGFLQNATTRNIHQQIHKQQPFNISWSEYYLTTGYAGKTIVSVTDKNFDYSNIFDIAAKRFRKFSAKFTGLIKLLKKKKIDSELYIMKTILFF
jgi:hypothetical protein